MQADDPHAALAFTHPFLYHHDLSEDLDLSHVETAAAASVEQSQLSALSNSLKRSHHQISEATTTTSTAYNECFFSDDESAKRITQETRRGSAEENWDIVYGRLIAYKELHGVRFSRRELSIMKHFSRLLTAFSY
jgi:hypothetical protein